MFNWWYQTDSSLCFFFSDKGSAMTRNDNVAMWRWSWCFFFRQRVQQWPAMAMWGGDAENETWTAQTLQVSGCEKKRRNRKSALYPGPTEVLPDSRAAEFCIFCIFVNCGIFCKTLKYVIFEATNWNSLPEPIFSILEQMTMLLDIILVRGPKKLCFT